MQSLLLDFNPLLEDGCSNLLLLLRCLPNLTTLSLKSISLEPGAVVPPPLLSEALAAGTRLEHLDLSFTRLSVEDLDNLFVSLSQLPLVQLNLTAVLSERSKVLACHRLSNYFRNGSPRLRHLSLAHCSLDDNCLDELLQRLSEKYAICVASTFNVRMVSIIDLQLSNAILF